jgi:predicted anti-sigma-YlaC factor YlaD
MEVTRDVIKDLLPLYVAGEGSPATRALVAEYLARDPELAAEARVFAEATAADAGVSPPAEIELEALRRTKATIAWMRWLFGFGISFVAVALTTRLKFEGDRLIQVRPLITDRPLTFGGLLLIGFACLAGYFWLRSRLKMTLR